MDHSRGESGSEPSTGASIAGFRLSRSQDQRFRALGDSPASDRGGIVSVARRQTPLRSRPKRGSHKPAQGIALGVVGTALGFQCTALGFQCSSTLGFLRIVPSTFVYFGQCTAQKTIVSQSFRHEHLRFLAPNGAPTNQPRATRPGFPMHHPVGVLRRVRPAVRRGRRGLRSNRPR